MSEIDQTGASEPELTPETATDEQLLEILDREPEEQQDLFAAEPEPEPELEVEEPEAETEEPEVAAEAEESPAAEEAAEEETEEVPDEIAEKNAYIAELEARHAEARATADRLLGEQGYFKSQIEQFKQMARSPVPEPQVDDFGDTVVAPAPAPTPQPGRGNPSQDAERVQAIQKAAQRFAANFPDAVEVGQDGQQNLSKEMLNQLNRLNVDPAILANASAFQASELTEAMLMQARSKVLVDKARQEKERIMALRSKTSEKLIKKKRAAAMPAVNTQAPPRKASRPTDPRKMKTEDIKKELDAFEAAQG